MPPFRVREPPAFGGPAGRRVGSGKTHGPAFVSRVFFWIPLDVPPRGARRANTNEAARECSCQSFSWISLDVQRPADGGCSRAPRRHAATAVFASRPAFGGPAGRRVGSGKTHGPASVSRVFFWIPLDVPPRGARRANTNEAATQAARAMCPRRTSARPL